MTIVNFLIKEAKMEFDIDDFISRSKDGMGFGGYLRFLENGSIVSSDNSPEDYDHKKRVANPPSKNIGRF